MAFMTQFSLLSAKEKIKREAEIRGKKVVLCRFLTCIVRACRQALVSPAVAISFIA
jgi:hypothetical protein